MVLIAHRYNPTTKKFEQSVDSPSYGEQTILSYDSFDDFYNALNGNLHNCDLVDYDFAGVDVSRYNLEGSMLSSPIMRSLGRYDSRFFERNIKTIIQTEESGESSSLTDYSSALTDPSRYLPNSYRYSIFYITDIHLDQKLFSKYPNACNESEVRHYCNTIIDNFVHDLDEYEYNNPYLLIGGDLTSNINICRIFFEQLTAQFDPKRIIYVLGNHELWATHNDSNTSYDEIMREYQSLADSLNIALLENQLLMVKDGRQVYDWEDLMNASNKDLIEEFSNSDLLVLGGVGFSPLNTKINASSGQYMHNIDPIQERSLSSRFEALYSRLKEVLWFKPLVVLTHMPKHDWSNSSYCPIWSYVNGHNHQNYMEVNNQRAIYSDNQIGYPEGPIHLKMFDLSRSFDIFHDWPNGIYEINSNDYRRFYREIGLNLTFNRNAIITMLKNSGMYMFLLKSSNGGYNILDGGSFKRLPVNDVNYYFDNMAKFSNTISRAFDEYFKTLRKISDAVRSFGGCGIIHGCIVDIDFLNHIFLNPCDGSVIPYHATSIVDKLVYRSVRTLLSNHCPDLLPSLESATNDRYSQLSTLIPVSPDDGKPIRDYDTNIYRYSKVVRGFQYMTDYRIIRRWDDNLINNDHASISALIDLSQ